MRRAALVAALAQILWCMLLIVPQVFEFRQMDIWGNKELLVFECSSLAIFFFAVCWKCDQLSSSAQMRFAALAAAICLGIENLLPTYFTIRGVVLSSKDLFAWKNHPFVHMRYVLAPTVPTIAVISFVAFLVATYQMPSRLEQQVKSRAADHWQIGVRSAALLAFIATIVALGQLLSFVTTTPIWQTPGFLVRFALRLLSLASLALFFLFVWAAQRSRNRVRQNPS